MVEAGDPDIFHEIQLVQKMWIQYQQEWKEGGDEGVGLRWRVGREVLDGCGLGSIST